MKKMFLLIPVGLIAASGLLWIDAQNNVQQGTPKAVNLPSKTPDQLFTLSQESLRLILRHGNRESIPMLESSVAELEKVFPKYEKQGLNVDKVERLLTQYKEDSAVLSQTAQPFLEQLKEYDIYEEKEEPKFIQSIKQIGLHELKAAYEQLSRTRLNYLKEPSPALEEEYRASASTLTQTIKELYLDNNIEDPLYAYLDNHKKYFETSAAYYKKAGIDRVHRLRENTYAIKTEIQMLPSL